MTDVNGIPNLGFLGGQTGGVIGGIPNQQPAMSAAQINNSIWGNYNPAAAQQVLNQNFSNFGQQTAYHSALAAAYGRATGGFNGGGNSLPGYYPAGDVQSSDLLPLDYNDSAGMPSDGGGVSSGWSYLPDGTPVAGGGGFGRAAGNVQMTPGAGGGMGSVFDPGTYQQRFNWQGYMGDVTGSGGQANNPAPSNLGYNYHDPATYNPGTSWRTPTNPTVQNQLGYDPLPAGGYYAGGGAAWSPFGDAPQGPIDQSYFNPGTYAGDQGNYGIPYQGAQLPGDIGFSRQNPMPNLGYNPGMANWFANGAGANPVADRFGSWGQNAGTPSQYTSQPYTNTGGQTFNPNMPATFAPAYSADQQNGALPLWGPGGSYQPGG
jgi:hypothetical protein